MITNICFFKIAYDKMLTVLIIYSYCEKII